MTYEADFLEWVTEQAAALRKARPNSVDWENLAEELDAMGRAERRALASQLERLMAHLLKWQYQPDRRSKSWQRSICDSRTQIDRLLDDSPSLTGALPELVVVEWTRAVRRASVETGIHASAFPLTCCWSITDLRDADFLPQ
jgi:hypothetical protein